MVLKKLLNRLGGWLKCRCMMNTIDPINNKLYAKLDWDNDKRIIILKVKDADDFESIRKLVEMCMMSCYYTKNKKMDCCGELSGVDVET